MADEAVVRVELFAPAQWQATSCLSLDQQDECASATARIALTVKLLAPPAANFDEFGEVQSLPNHLCRQDHPDTRVHWEIELKLAPLIRNTPPLPNRKVANHYAEKRCPGFRLQMHHVVATDVGPIPLVFLILSEDRRAAEAAMGEAVNKVRIYPQRRARTHT